MEYKFVRISEIKKEGSGKYFTIAECLEFDESSSTIKLKDLENEETITLPSIFKANKNEIVWVFFTKEDNETKVDFIKKSKLQKEFFKRFLKIYNKWGRKYV